MYQRGPYTRSNSTSSETKKRTHSPVPVHHEHQRYISTTAGLPPTSSSINGGNGHNNQYRYNTAAAPPQSRRVVPSLYTSQYTHHRRRNSRSPPPSNGSVGAGPSPPPSSSSSSFLTYGNGNDNVTLTTKRRYSDYPTQMLSGGVTGGGVSGGGGGGRGRVILALLALFLTLVATISVLGLVLFSFLGERSSTNTVLPGRGSAVPGDGPSSVWGDKRHHIGPIIDGSSSNGGGATRLVGGGVHDHKLRGGNSNHGTDNEGGRPIVHGGMHHHYSGGTGEGQGAVNNLDHQKEFRNNNDGGGGGGVVHPKSNLGEEEEEEVGNKVPDDFFMASHGVEGGGYAYLPVAVDVSPLSVSLWVNLQPFDDGMKGDRRRVILMTERKGREGTSNPSGMNNNDECLGSALALYVQDQELVLEYAIRSDGNDESSGALCRKVKSTGQKLSNLEEWMHLGFTISPITTSAGAGGGGDSEGRRRSAGRIKLYVDGTVVAETNEPSRLVGVSRSSTTKSTNKREVERTTLLGRERTDKHHTTYTPNHSLHGKIAMVGIWHHEQDGTTTTTPEIPTAVQENSLMHATYRCGFDTNAMMHLNDQGFVKNPSFLWTFDGQKGDDVLMDAITTVPELIQNHQPAKIYRHVLLPSNDDLMLTFLPQPGNPKMKYGQYRKGLNQPKLLTQSQKQQTDTVARIRRTHIRNAMKHVWDGYRTYAYGFDELMPISSKGKNNWGGLGNTLIDSLSTLWLMDMKDEFYEGRDWVRDYLSFDHVGAVSVFETTIRSLGGLLSAYDVSSDKVFLEKANDLGTRLVKAFDTDSGIPYGETLLNGDRSFNTGWHADVASLAELGTLQVEFRYLARATGNDEYERKVMKVLDVMETIHTDSGLYPIYIRNKVANPTVGNHKISMGAMGDSFYEYLLKIWLQGGRKETKYRKMYDRAMDGLHDLLVKESRPGYLTYIAEMENNKVIHKMDHLACFMGGNLALGAYTHPEGLNSEKAQRDLRVGKAFAYTCYQMYTRMKSGISPEYVTFNTDANNSAKKQDFDKPPKGGFYILRPETIESFFILNQLTGDPIYREWGWEIFKSIEFHCKTDVGYASLRDVDRVSSVNGKATQDDKMESFFLAETLKYMYLLQDPDTEIDILNKHVFNTEAHPLRMFDHLPSRQN